jgi:uncharacterized protein YecT (DUF1311 family)
VTAVRVILRLLACALAATAVVGEGPAAAASFDCRAAATKIERLLCTDQDAGAADEAMAKAYGQLVQTLTPAGGELVRASQRKFVTALAEQCVVAPRLGNGRDWQGRSSAQCLADTMAERTAQLQSARSKAGPWQFLQIETSEAWIPDAGWPIGSTGAGAPRPVVDSSIVLRIEPTKSSGEADWNKAMAKAVELALADSRGDEPGRIGRDPMYPQDNQAAANLVSVSPDLIIADISQGWYAFGSPHGAGRTQTVAWSFRLGRALTAGDVFLPGWEKAIGSLIWQGMLANGWTADMGVLETASEHQALRFSQKGICVSFDPYEVAGYVSPSPVSIPWKVLRPLMNAELPFDHSDLIDARDELGCWS